MSNIKLIVILLLSFALFSGCAGIDTIVYIPADDHVKKKHHKIGPPPHAPAHGYRHKHHCGYRHKHHRGVELEYDTGIGAYILVEFPGTYFYNGLYARYSPKEHWVVAEHLDGPWRVSVEREIPPKLKKGNGKYHPGKGKNHGKGKKNKKW